MITADEAWELTKMGGEKMKNKSLPRIRRLLERQIRRAASKGETCCTVGLWPWSNRGAYEAALQELGKRGFCVRSYSDYVSISWD